MTSLCASGATGVQHGSFEFLCATPAQRRAWKVSQVVGKSSHGRRGYKGLGLFWPEIAPVWTLHLRGVSGLTATGGMMKRIKNIAITITAIFLFGGVFY